jgi:FKBP-type peptidyl-prolyl cis-trans isomerase
MRQRLATREQMKAIARCLIPASVAVTFVLLGCKTTPEANREAQASATAAVPASAPAATQTAAVAAAASATESATESDIPAPENVAAAPADAQKSASGLASKVLTKGTGKDHPSAYDTVKVHYTGWTKAGKMFDSSIRRGEPAEFPLNGVIKGWTEGLQLMVVGEKRRFWIPGALAYGDHAGMGTPSGDLVFDVELLEVKVAPKPPAVPEDVKAAPASAKKTESGLQYRVLKPGTGKKHPAGTDSVVVHYTGWTPDGKMFDSSVTRGQPATFGVGGVIKGWTEGLKLMVEGEKTRFWIPGSLAYGDGPSRGGAPTGTLVFDVELVSIK